MKPDEKGWLPDLLYVDGRLVPAVALIADEKGTILRLSREREDLEPAERLAGRAIFPGFVNAHSHSFQRTIRGRTEYRKDGKDTFWTWREKMYQAANVLNPEEIYVTARMCFLEMALSGITTVGEFHYLHHKPDGSRYPDPNLLAKEVVRAAREVGLRIVLLQTGYARAGWNKGPNPGQARFLFRNVREFIGNLTALRVDLGKRYAPDEVWVGIAPHSLRAVTLADFREMNRYGREETLPVHMHVSEQRAENEDCLKENGKTPIALLEDEKQLHPGFTAIHAVHVSEAEIAALRAAKANVCACPTTERNLGDGVVPADRLLAAGVNLALGSDSQVQIDLLDDARQLEYHLRLLREERVVLGPKGLAAEDQDRLAGVLLGTATEAGARSLGAPGGSLEPGRSADFLTFDLRKPCIAGSGISLAALIFGTDKTAIRDVAVGGRFIVRDGCHANEPEIVREFEAVQAKLWGERCR
jgi:formimidoylglutamate deiminase